MIDKAQKLLYVSRMDNPFSGHTGCQNYFAGTHQMVRRAVREFVRKEVQPHIDQWEEAGEFPRSLYEKAAALDILGLGYPEECGGTPGDIFLKIAVTEELMRSGSGGLVAGLGSLDIALPPIIRHGTPGQKKKFVQPVLRGTRIAALAVTEPGGGSDVANLQTTAERRADGYVVNGCKTFITSGCRADQLTCAVRTGESGARGISLLVIESDSPGYAVSENLKKTGWWASDTAEIYFDNCMVPAENLIGDENRGFHLIMENFQLERLVLAVMANMSAELALSEAIGYAGRREAFGRTLSGHQVIRHKLADMATLVEVSREFTYRIAAKIDAGLNQTKEVAMAKNFACAVSDRVTHEAVQIFGGYGCMRGFLVERLYRDSRILSIGGGTTEIMKEIISKMLKL